MKRALPILLLLGLLLLACNLALSIWNSQRTRTIAFVRSQELVYGYFGMKEAMDEFQTKQVMWKANRDTLALDLQRSIAQFRSKQETAKTGAKDLQLSIQRQQQDLKRFDDAMQSKLKEEEKAMLEAVLAQVNSFVEEYAQAHGYDVVLGTTNSGSLLYGEGGMDITDDLLLALNKEFEGS